MAAKRFGLLLFRGPDSEDIRTAIGLADAALKRGIGVDFFLMHAGVLNSAVKDLEALVGKGATVTVCSHNADELRAFRHEAFTYGSQYDNSNLAGDADRYLAFI